MVLQHASVEVLAEEGACAPQAELRIMHQVLVAQFQIAVRAKRLSHLVADHRLPHPVVRSEEHTSELQSLMRISYAVSCSQKKNKTHQLSSTINKLHVGVYTKIQNKHLNTTN